MKVGRILFPLAAAAAIGAASPGIPAEFYPTEFQWNDALREVATDVSFLNTRPAGANGRIVARGEEFVESRTGKPIRFIGIGMGGRAALELDRENARKLASRLAKNGVNVVRFHNLDGGNARDSIIDASMPDTRHFNAEKLDAFDYLFHCLKEEGIYVIMPLKVNRQLKPGDDVSDGTKHKFVDRFDKRWIELQKEFARNALLHVNPYTGLSPAEDPAVLGVELNNEDCMFRPWVNTDALIRGLTPFHRAELEKRWEEYQREQNENAIPLDRAAWEQKAAFLTELDTRYSKLMRDFVKNELKVEALVVDTQMDWGGLAGLKREAESDYTDTHGYWNHPEFRGTPWKFTRGNWYVRNESQLGYLASRAQCKLIEIASWRPAGKPFSISEYDYPYPCDYTVEMMPLLAVVASRQNWNALHLFIHGMTVGYDSNRISSMFDQSNHPGKIGFFPAAALIYRTRMFEPAGEREELRLPRNPHTRFRNQFDRAWEKTPGGKWRDLMKTQTVISGSGLDLDEEVAESVLKRNPAPRTETVIEKKDDKVFFRAASPRGMILIGDFGGSEMSIGKFRISAKPFPGDFGAAVVVSRTEDPIASSASSLLTVAGRFDNLGIQFNRHRTSTQVSSGSVPGLIDCQIGAGPVVGVRLDLEVSVPADGPRQVFALADNGSRRDKVKSDWSDGAVTFRVSPDEQSMYYEIIK